MKQKSENRKAMPKFILVLAVSLVVGLLCGICIAVMEGDWTAALGDTLMRALSGASPWILLGLSILSAAVQFLLYRRAKQKFDNWDGEEEQVLEEIDGTLNLALIVNSTCLILSYCLVGIPFSRMRDLSFATFGLSLLGLVLAMIIMVIGQQKLIDFTKKLYPEKQGSVYDPKFQKVWYESCDEAERAMIANAAYAAYKATCTACLILWIVAILGDLLFHYGFLPSLFVCIIWLVNTLSYCITCLKQGKSGLGA